MKKILKKTLLVALVAISILGAGANAQSQTFPVDFQTLPVYWYAQVGHFFTPTSGLLGCQGGIVRTIGGNTWDTVYAAKYGVVSMTFAENGELGYAIYTNAWGQMPSILKTTDRGTSWQSLPSPYDFSRLIVRGNELFGLANGTDLYRSLDNATTWQWVKTFPWYGAPMPMLSTGRNILYYACGSRIWQSSNLTDWTQMTTPLGSNTFHSADNDMSLVSGQDFINSDGYPGVAFTKDNGTTWEHYRNEDLIGDASHALYTPKGIFVTVTDNYFTYQRGQLFVVQNDIWTKLIDTGAVFTGLAYKDGKVLCYGFLSEEVTCSVLLTIDLTVTNISGNISLPTGFELKQNSPNPFNPVTKINFTLPKAAFVSLRVYDITGKIVRNLLEESKVAGTYSVDFNGAMLSSGTYFYTLQADGYAVTKKMILTK